MKDKISPFYSEITKTMAELENKFKSVESLYEKLSLFFVENPKQTPSDKFMDKFYKLKLHIKNNKNIILKTKLAE